MRLRIACVAALALAGCASMEATSGLNDARAFHELHNSAPIHVNVDLADQGGMSESQRAPLIKAKREASRACEDAFQQRFAELLGTGGQQIGAVLSAADALDAEYGACIRPAGLVGHPEFQVGTQYLRPHAFVWSYYQAQQQLQQAQARVDHERSMNSMGLAAGFAGAGAAMRSAYTPPPQPAITYRPEIRCTTAPSVGGYTSTTCR